MSIHSIQPSKLQRSQDSQKNDHGKFCSDKYSGKIALLWHALRKHPVLPRTGHFTINRNNAVVAASATFRAQPCLPGTGIKGAVRSLTEILAAGCNPIDSACHASNRCRTCNLFGTRGWMGRINFSDGIPGAEPIERHTAWLPSIQKARKPNSDGDSYCFFGLQDPVPKKSASAVEAYSGTFHGHLHFSNLTPAELGLMLLSLGISCDDYSGFYLRMGGAKSKGYGCVSVQPGDIALIYPERKTIVGEKAHGTCSKWMKAAVKADFFQSNQYKHLQKVLGGCGWPCPKEGASHDSI